MDLLSRETGHFEVVGYIWLEEIEYLEIYRGDSVDIVRKGELDFIDEAPRV